MKTATEIFGELPLGVRNSVEAEKLKSSTNDSSENLQTDGCQKKFSKMFIILMIIVFSVYLVFAGLNNFAKMLPLLVTVAVVVATLIFNHLLQPFIVDKHWDVAVAKFGKQLQTKLFKKHFAILMYASILITIAVFVVYDTWNDRTRLIPLGGISLIICMLILLSTRPTKINFRVVFCGFVLQFGIGFLVLKWSKGLAAFQWLSERTVGFLDFTFYGTDFVYGFLSKPPNICSMTPVFIFTVLQVIIFFGSVISFLYYLGVIQFVMSRLGKFFQFVVGTTGVESLYACCCILLGQSEAPIVIQHYLPYFTRSELNTIMTIGFACSAGSVFAAYVSMGACPLYVFTACIMSSPGSIAVSKILMPETEKSKLKTISAIKLPKSTDTNIIEALSSGACSVISVVASIAANLVAFMAILYFVDEVVKYFADLVGVDLGFQALLGYIFFPFAFVMGVSDKPDWSGKMKDTMIVAQLLGTKTSLNEFIALKKMGELVASGQLTGRAQMMATYALSSFSNFSSIGVQLGIFGNLCPEKKGIIAQTAFRALLGGCMCSIITACIAGILVETPFVCTPRNSLLNCTQI